MTLEDRLHRLPHPPVQPAMPLAQPSLRERLQAATLRHAEAEAGYKAAMAEMAAALEDTLNRRYQHTVTVSAGSAPGWLKLGFFPSSHHPDHTPMALYLVAEQHGLLLAPTPSEQPHEYRIFRTTDWLLSVECLRGIGPVTVMLNAGAVDDALLFAVLDRYYQIPRRAHAA